MSVNQAYLHTVHCSPSRSGFHTGAHTRHKGRLPRSAAPPVVLPLASYTPYSERARGPHKCGRRHGRLQIGKTGRKQLKDQVWVSITVGPSRGQNHLASSGGVSLQKRILLEFHTKHRARDTACERESEDRKMSLIPQLLGGLSGRMTIKPSKLDNICLALQRSTFTERPFNIMPSVFIEDFQTHLYEGRYSTPCRTGRYVTDHYAHPSCAMERPRQQSLLGIYWGESWLPKQGGASLSVSETSQSITGLCFPWGVLKIKAGSL